MQEIELKFLDIDVEDITARLEEIGAMKMYDSTVHSMLFHAEGFSGWDSTKKFLRVRKADEKVLITYKAPEEHSSMTSRHEVECEVGDYDDAIALLAMLGFYPGEEYNKRRVHYELGSVSFELDTVGSVPTYLEVETTTEEEMEKICKALCLDISMGKKGTIVEIFPELFLGE